MPRGVKKKHPLSADSVQKSIASIFDEDLHAKRVLSLANAATCVCQTPTTVELRTMPAGARAQGRRPVDV